MIIKDFIKFSFTALFAVFVTFIGCKEQESKPNSQLALLVGLATMNRSVGDATVSASVNCLANSPSKYNGPNYSYASSASATTVISAVNDTNTSYDVSNYCTTAINARRQTTHSRTKNGTATTIKPYYSLSSSNVVPAYTAVTSNIAATTGSSVCRLCKGLADAKAGDHAGYGMCYGISPDETGPTTNEVSVGWCGATIGKTAQEVVDSCLNSFENEDGAGAGHKGPIVWDTTRGISCIVGVYVDPTTGAKKAGISISYSYPPRNAAAANGDSCKVSGECLSKKCSNSRCVGFASSIPDGSSAVTQGVSTCPIADSKNCTEHPEDSALCVSKNLACSSGVCLNATCQQAMDLDIDKVETEKSFDSKIGNTDFKYDIFAESTDSL